MIQRVHVCQPAVLTTKGVIRNIVDLTADSNVALLIAITTKVHLFANRSVTIMDVDRVRSRRLILHCCHHSLIPNSVSKASGVTGVKVRT